MRNVKKRAFSVLGAILSDKASFQRLLCHSDYHTFGAYHPCRHNAELVSVSRRMASESGRSMLEMLGVLAVIGVLSIGGIAGYRTAMDYYKANEIINDVHARATAVAADIAANGSLFDVPDGLYETDFGETNTLGYTVKVMPDNGAFMVTVLGVDETLCHHLTNRPVTDTPILEIAVNGKAGLPCLETNDIDFLFSNDLGQTITFERVGFDSSRYEACDNDDACNGGKCVFNRCISKADYCSARYFSKQSEECVADEFCIGYECVVPYCQTDSDCILDAHKPYCQKSISESFCAECTENAHCGEGFYCGGGTVTSYKSTVNRCVRADFAKTKAGDDSYMAADGHTYYLSKNTMPWWDGKNFCDLFGLSLVPATAFNTVVGTNHGAGTGATLTDLARELYEAFGAHHVWTATDCGTPSGNTNTTGAAYTAFLLGTNNTPLYCPDRIGSYYVMCR